MRKFQFNTATGGGSFSGEVAVSALVNDDQWQPAVDVAPDCTCLVTYYDYNHADGADRVRYRIYGKKVNADGTAIPGEFDTRLLTAWKHRTWRDIRRSTSLVILFTR
ncbi:MAG TPA: hypothetical protein VNN08_11815 [Thermoanaerobaculia bacterium]|nr:hypothetical protein [Thermoanaerobaculia bacterium]